MPRSIERDREITNFTPSRLPKVLNLKFLAFGNSRSPPIHYLGLSGRAIRLHPSFSPFGNPREPKIYHFALSGRAKRQNDRFRRFARIIDRKFVILITN